MDSAKMSVAGHVFPPLPDPPVACVVGRKGRFDGSVSSDQCREFPRSNGDVDGGIREVRTVAEAEGARVQQGGGRQQLENAPRTGW